MNTIWHYSLEHRHNNNDGMWQDVLKYSGLLSCEWVTIMWCQCGFQKYLVQLCQSNWNCLLAVCHNTNNLDVIKMHSFLWVYLLYWEGVGFNSRTTSVGGLITSMCTAQEQTQFTPQPRHHKMSRVWTSFSSGVQTTSVWCQVSHIHHPHPKYSFGISTIDSMFLLDLFSVASYCAILRKKETTTIRDWHNEL